MLKIFRFRGKLLPSAVQHLAAFSSESKEGSSFHAGSSDSEGEDISQDYLKHIVCPLTKKSLIYDKNRQLLISDELSIGYKISNGIPNMIPTEAIKLEKS